LSFIGKREKSRIEKRDLGRIGQGLAILPADDPRRRSAANGGGTLDANGALNTACSRNLTYSRIQLNCPAPPAIAVAPITVATPVAAEMTFGIVTEHSMLA
jgi:hypothetical protein